MVTLRPKKGKSSAHVDLLVEDGGPIEGNLETRRECQKAAQLERPSNPRARSYSRFMEDKQGGSTRSERS
jgi:hypothetical protein